MRVYCESRSLRENLKGREPTLVLSLLKAGSTDFHGWWTPIGDEDLFSEQQENSSFLNVFSSGEIIVEL